MPLNIGLIGARGMGSTLACHLTFARRQNSGGLIAEMATHDFDLVR
jgi:hypothetical protein